MIFLFCLVSWGIFFLFSAGANEAEIFQTCLFGCLGCDQTLRSSAVFAT